MLHESVNSWSHRSRMLFFQLMFRVGKLQDGTNRVEDEPAFNAIPAIFKDVTLAALRPNYRDRPTAQEMKIMMEAVTVSCH